MTTTFRDYLSFLFVLPFAKTLFILFVSGCASAVPNLVSDLDTQTSCCTSYAEFGFTKIPLDKEFKFSIDKGDKVFAFPSGKSYFQAFELPSVDENYLMEVRTYLVGEWIPTAHVFGPFLIFLDPQFGVLEEEIFPRLFFDEGFVEGARWTGGVQVPSNATYVVLYTKPELINTRIALGNTSGYGYSTGSGFVYVPPSGERSSSFGPAGNLRIRFLKNVR